MIRRIGFIESMTIIALVVVGLTQLRGMSMGEIPPPEWSLEQNDPNPFCNDPGVTTFMFGVAQDAQVLVQIWNPDATAVMKTLTDGALQIGMYDYTWDGTDDAGGLLPCGNYPYTMTATEEGTGAILFEDSKVATILCNASATEDETWGEVKSRYR